MRLPAMKYLEGNRKRTQIRFGGLNHTEGARDGELWDMKNLSGDHYPVLATRAQRVKIRDMKVSGGILHWNKLCWIDECDFYYDGERKGDVEEGVIEYLKKSETPAVAHLQKLRQCSFSVLCPIFLMLLDQIQLFLSPESSFIGMVGLPLLFLLASIVDGVHYAEAFVPLND